VENPTVPNADERWVIGSVSCPDHADPFKRVAGFALRAAVTLVALVAAGCTETLDAGSSRPLPVDERNPVLLVNDEPYRNWQGEYAMLLAQGGGTRLAGIIVGTSMPWPDLNSNLAGWQDMVAAARASNMSNIPDPIASVGATLVRPESGDIELTTANRSVGAQAIVDISLNLSPAERPLVVATGGRLTDVADAYLIDRTVRDRVVVVSALGLVSASGGEMGDPNGKMDPWADAIVAARFRYVQVSAYYDQFNDVPASRLPELPINNPFATWIGEKQPSIWSMETAADQVAVAAVGIPGFVVEVERVSAATVIAAGATTGPILEDDPKGSVWLVRQVAGAVARERFWELLLAPTTYGQR
jgi:hypothetical protein